MNIAALSDEPIAQAEPLGVILTVTTSVGSSKTSVAGCTRISTKLADAEMETEPVSATWSPPGVAAFAGVWT